MTKTVLIEGLINTLKGIATKIESNPSGSHLETDVVGERGVGDDMVAVLNDSAKKTPLTSCEVDFEPTIDGTPSVADPSTINLIGTELGLVMLDADEGEDPKMYQISLGHPAEGALDAGESIAKGHIDVTNGVVTVTHVSRIMTDLSEDWYKDTDNDGSFYCEIFKIKPDSEFVCNMGEWIAPASYAADKVTTDNDNVKFWFASSGASLEDWQDFLQDHTIEIVYELDEPITYTINPTEIKTLNCYNNVVIAYQAQVSALNVTYVRDESKAIEALEAGGGSGVTTEVIMGDLDRVYGTTTDNYIGTFNAWASIDEGKSFADYDEIMLVMKPQQSTLSYGEKVYTCSVKRDILQHYDKYAMYAFPEGGTTTYVKCGLDYTNNKIYLENFNYMCPIALVGVKY